ncbi:MAG: hypothetical protein AMK72_12945 [Planctomycetes bacterium SM23_25]|nr:MAG: hypothetical protein AMK72_12945 [Planctomycetes bacterium SM23_25]
MKNTLKQGITGTLAFELPKGVTVEPAAPRFGPLPPGATAQVRVTWIAGRGAPQGRWLIPYRVSYRTGEAAQEVRTAALPFHIVVGPVLEFVYRHPQRNAFRVNAPRYVADMDMDSGITRYLADDDGAVRLNGGPMFTFSDGKKSWLFDGCTNNSTWPSSVPAALTGAPSAYGDCRYRMRFRPDRITTRMDPGWTRFDPTHFTVPGKWVSPRGAPAWARIVAVDAGGKEVDARPGTKLKVAAAELAFPGAKWHLAFAFTPPQPVTFKDAWRKGR